MGEALIGGLLAAGWASADELLVIEPAEGRRAELHATFPGLPVAAALESHHAADGALIAVKPQYVAAVCRELAPRVQRVLSIAAGVPIATMEAALAKGAPDRAIPVVR